MSVTYMLHICPHIYAIYVVAYMAYMVHICSFLYAAYMSFPYGNITELIEKEVCISIRQVILIMQSLNRFPEKTS